VPLCTGANHLTEQMQERQLTLLLHNLRMRYVGVVKMKVDKTTTDSACLKCDALLTNERSNHDCYNPENNRI